MKVRWIVTWGDGKSVTVKHFHAAFRLANDLREAGYEAEITSVEETG